MTLVALIAIPVTALPADTPLAEGLARCSEIGTREARLACYDQLAGRPPDLTSRAPMADPNPVPGAARPSTGGKSASPPAVADDDPRNFGLNPAQIHSTPQGPASIQGRITRLVSGQGGSRGYVVLDNGQTWVFTDADEDKRLRTGDSVTIRRGALTSYILTSNSKRAYHVRRTR